MMIDTPTNIHHHHVDIRNFVAPENVGLFLYVAADAHWTQARMTKQDTGSNNNNEVDENTDDQVSGTTTTTTTLLIRKKVVYCGACGMPCEYCSYGPDYETHCVPWLQQNHGNLYQHFMSLALNDGKQKQNNNSDNDSASASASAAKSKVAPAPAPATAAPAASTALRPPAPWTIEQRLTAFYQKYVPDKISNIPDLLIKYANKEENLFKALVAKYGPEPWDPFYGEPEEDGDDVDDDDDDDEEEEEEEASDDNDHDNDHDRQEIGDNNNDHAAAAVMPKQNNKRRGVAAKKNEKAFLPTRIIVKKVAQKKKRYMTIVTGMETISGSSAIKLKDIAKEFSKKFACSSSVKDATTTTTTTTTGTTTTTTTSAATTHHHHSLEEIWLQGDHLFAVAEFICDKYGVSESAVFLDYGDGGSLIPLR
jgi:density-regulated protein